MFSFKRVALAGAIGVGALVAAAVPASAEGAADFVGGAQYNGGRAVFVAKDLGGGAYWLSTTTAVTTMQDGAATGAETLLTVNDAVLRPVEDAIAP
jgi:hypothetical protein